MGLFDEITNTVMNAGQAVGDRVKTAVDVTKASYEVKETEHKLRDAYAELGRRYFQDHREDPGEDFSEIETLLEKLEEKKDTVDSLKKTQTCPACGSSVSKESVFCPKCGEKMPVSQEAEAADEEKAAPTAEPDAFVDEEAEGSLTPENPLQDRAVEEKAEDRPAYSKSTEEGPVEEFVYGELRKK